MIAGEAPAGLEPVDGASGIWAELEATDSIDGQIWLLLDYAHREAAYDGKYDLTPLYAEADEELAPQTYVLNADSSQLPYNFSHFPVSVRLTRKLQGHVEPEELLSCRFIRIPGEAGAPDRYRRSQRVHNEASGGFSEKAGLISLEELVDLRDKLVILAQDPRTFVIKFSGRNKRRFFRKFPEYKERR